MGNPHLECELVEHTLIYGECATGKTIESRKLIEKYLKDSQTGSLLIYDHKAVDYLDYQSNPRLYRPICSDPQTNWFIHFLEDALQEDEPLLIVIDTPTTHFINQEKEVITKLMFKPNITIILVIYDKSRLDNQITSLFKTAIFKDRLNKKEF